MKKTNEHGERVTKREAESLRKRLGRQAKGCALFGTSGCPFATCVVALQTERIASNTCPVFVREVLPEDKELERDYFDALPDSHPLKPAKKEPRKFRKCEVCADTFEPSGNRQKYCADCRKAQDKRQARERQQNKRLA